MKKQIKRITAVAAAAALAISFTFPAELGLADFGVGGNAIAASAETSGDFEYSVDVDSGNVKITKYIGSGVLLISRQQLTENLLLPLDGVLFNFVPELQA